MPAFNAQEFAEKCVSSLLKLKSQLELEIIFINDGSTDDTSEVLKQYEGKITILQSENKGESAAVNLGLGECTQPYALVLSVDDDPPVLEYLLESVELLNNNGNVVATCTDWCKVDVQGNKIEVVRVPNFNWKDMLSKFVCFPGPGSVFRVDAGKIIGGRDVDLVFIGDFDFWIRLGRLGNFRKIDGVNSFWTQHANSKTSSGDYLIMINERISWLNTILTHEKFNYFFKSKAKASCLLSCAGIAKNRNSVKFATLLLKSVLIYPPIIFRIFIKARMRILKSHFYMVLKGKNRVRVIELMSN